MALRGSKVTGTDFDGENVRLKDIVELFMHTGLGRDGYSIIGQGRIADIVSSKSTDRREIFEEAAGISKFRYKKEEAERKLVAAEDNISRITDILSELESRLGPLKTQSEKAKDLPIPVMPLLISICFTSSFLSFQG